MDIFDLKNSIVHGDSLRKVADVLCRSGTVDDVRRITGAEVAAAA